MLSRTFIRHSLPNLSSKGLPEVEERNQPEEEDAGHTSIGSLNGFSFATPTAASAADQPTILSSPLAPTALVAPVPYLPANIFNTSEPTMQADSVRSDV